MAATGAHAAQSSKTVARAAVQLTPSMKGFFKSIHSQMGGAQMSAAGVIAGNSISRGLNRSLGGSNGLGGIFSRMGASSATAFGSVFNNAITRTAGSAVSGLASNITNNVTGAIQGATSAIGTFGTTAVGAVGVVTAALATMTAFGGFNRALTIENAQSKLGSLGHDAQAVATIMNSALASVEGTIYSLDGAASAAANAIAAGIPKGDELTNWLKLIADTATVANAPLDDVARIMNRIQANGRAYTLEISMLMDRGIPVMSLLAEQMGITVAEVRKAVAEGEISAGILADTLHNKLGGAALASASTTTGAFANMRIAFSRFGAVIATQSLPYVRLFFLEIRDMVDMLNSRFGPALAGATEAMGRRAEPVITSMTERFSDFLDKLAVGGNFPFLDKLKSSMGGIYQEMYPVVAYFQSKLPTVLAAAGSVVGAIIAKMFVGSENKDSWLHSFSDGIRYINRELTPLYEMVGAYLPKILSRAEEMFGQLFRAAFIDSETNDSWLGSIVTLITTYVPKAIDTLVPMFDMLFTKAFIGEGGEESWVQKFLGLLGEVAGAIFPIIGIIVNDFVPALVSGFEQLQPYLGELILSIVTVGMTLITQLTPVILDLITALAPLAVALAVAFIQVTPHIVSLITWFAELAGKFAENEGLVQGLAIAFGIAFIAFQGISFIVGIVASLGAALSGVIGVLGTFFGWFAAGAAIIVRAQRLLSLGLLIIQTRGWIGLMTAMFPILTARIGAFIAAIAASHAWVLLSAAASRVAAAATWLWNAAMSANPIVLVTLAIIALVAGLIWFFTQTEVGKNAWASLVQAFQDGVAAVSRWLGEAGTNISNWWNDVTTSITNAWNSVVEFFSDTLTNVGNWFNDVFTNITDSFHSVAQWFIDIFTTVNETITGVIDNILGGIQNVMDWLGGMFDIFPEWLREGFGVGGNINIGVAGVGSLPAMATGGDIMGATALIAGEKEPETITNRGLTNRTLDAVQKHQSRIDRMMDNGGMGGEAPIVHITINQLAGESPEMLADKVVEAMKFRAMRG